MAFHFTDGFMKDDLRLLHQFANERYLELQRRHVSQGGLLKLFGIAKNILLFIYRLITLDIDVVVFWFASTYYPAILALIAKLFGRKIIVITGGIDVVYLQDIDWGDMKHWHHRLTFGILMRLADSVLPFSNASQSSILERYHPKAIRTAYPAIDTQFFTPDYNTIQRRVATCCYTYGEEQIVQKGLNIFVQAARELPEIEFVVTGDPADAFAREFQKTAPANVVFMPRIPSRSGYRQFLRSCSVYAQLSAHEGFGVCLAEAMSCGCVAVVSDRYSLPEVVGERGLIVPYNDPLAAARAIQRAVDSDRQLRQAARSRVVTLFDKSIRQELLFDDVARLIPGMRRTMTRLELGCGSTGVPGTIGVDMRKTAQTKSVCDIRRTCFRSEIADEVYSFCVLEHLQNPYELMDEVVRLLKPAGRAYLRVPNIGTFSAHLDPTHQFLADLKIWKTIMKGYFKKVVVQPEGLKYRDNLLLSAIILVLVKVFRFYELAQGWTFICENKRAEPAKAYVGWWMETEMEN